jgi:hypothetical protein
LAVLPPRPPLSPLLPPRSSPARQRLPGHRIRLISLPRALLHLGNKFLQAVPPMDEGKFTSPNPSGEVLVKFICLVLGVLIVPRCSHRALLFTLGIFLADLRICHVLV